LPAQTDLVGPNAESMGLIFPVTVTQSRDLMSKSYTNKPFAKEQLYADINIYHIDAAIIAELKLQGHHKDSFVAIPGYLLFCRYHVGRGGGGSTLDSASILTSAR